MRLFLKAIGQLAVVATFTLALVLNANAHIQVLAPNGGEQLEAGTVVTISWRIVIAHNTQNWDLWYSTTGSNGPWIPIVMNLPPGNTSANSVHNFDWTIPETMSDQCRVRVRMDNTGTDYEDISNSNFSIVVAPVEVNATAFSVTRGRYVSGGLVELAASDDADLSIRRSPSDLQSRTEFEVEAVSPVANPSSMELTLEGAVFARTPVSQSIELYDYDADQWELVDTRDAARFSDATVQITPSGDLSRFVEPGTLRMQARINYKSTNQRQQFSSNTDQVVWTIGS